MDLSNYAVAAGLLTFFVIGAVELVKQLFARNWKAATIIAVSGLVGAAGGFILPVIGWVVGLSIGLSASGLVTTAQKFGEGTASLPTAPVLPAAPVAPVVTAVPAPVVAPVAAPAPAEQPAVITPVTEAPITPTAPQA